MTTPAAALAGSTRTEVRRADDGGWEVVGRGYSGRVLAIVHVDTRAEAMRLSSAALLAR